MKVVSLVLGGTSEPAKLSLPESKSLKPVLLLVGVY